MQSIHDPSCIYLHQHLTTKGVDVTEPVTEVPEGWTFLRQLPEKVWKTEVRELIIERGEKVLYYSSSQLTVVTNSSAWHHDKSWSWHQNICKRRRQEFMMFTLLYFRLMP